MPFLVNNNGISDIGKQAEQVNFEGYSGIPGSGYSGELKKTDFVSNIL